MPIFCCMKCFDLEKNREKTFGMKRRCVEAKLGQKQSRAPVERFRRGNFPPGGGNRSHRHHQRSCHHGRNNLHQHLQQHHLMSNPNSSLVFNLCLKTSYWYLWVASSVDYSLQLMLVSSLVEDHLFRSLMLFNTPLVMNMNMLYEQLRLFPKTWEKSCYK